MKKFLSVLVIITNLANAQVEPAAGNWRTWFINSGKAFRLPAPAPYEKELATVRAKQQQTNNAAIPYWNAGAPGYRWQELMSGLWYSDTSYNGILANMLLNVAIYDATIAAWDSKYFYKRPRPFCNG